MKLHDFERRKEAWVVEDRGNNVKFTRLLCAGTRLRERNILYEVYIDTFTICAHCGAVTINESKATTLDVVQLEKLLTNALSVEELKQMQLPKVVSNVLRKDGVITDE